MATACLRRPLTMPASTALRASRSYLPRSVAMWRSSISTTRRSYFAPLLRRPDRSYAQSIEVSDHDPLESDFTRRCAHATPRAAGGLHPYRGDEPPVLRPPRVSDRTANLGGSS